MREFLRTKRFKVLACIFALLLGLMIYAAVTMGSETIPENILKTITNPFVELSNNISTWAEETLDKFVNADKYKAENEKLKEQLSEMYKEIMDKEQTDKENSYLRDIIGIIEENKDFECSAPCSIISRNANDIYGGFTIDRGTDEGIALYDPVFTSVGLVGYVTEVAPKYSTVTTILSTELNVGVVAQENKVNGVLENDIEHASEGLCLMSYITEGDKIKKGDLITTAGSVVFPSGLLVGTVEEVYTDKNSLSVHAAIKPFENIDKLSVVFVITNFEGQGIDTE